MPGVEGGRKTGGEKTGEEGGEAKRGNKCRTDRKGLISGFEAATATQPDLGTGCQVWVR